MQTYTKSIKDFYWYIIITIILAITKLPVLYLKIRPNSSSSNFQ